MFFIHWRVLPLSSLARDIYVVSYRRLYSLQLYTISLLHLARSLSEYLILSSEPQFPPFFIGRLFSIFCPYQCHIFVIFALYTLLLPMEAILAHLSRNAARNVSFRYLSSFSIYLLIYYSLLPKQYCFSYISFHLQRLLVGCYLLSSTI